jgi:hypothetical protein
MGSWKINIAKSKFGTGQPPKSQTLKFEPSGDGFKFTTDSIAADGQPNHTESVAKLDGKDYPVKGGRGATARTYKRIDDRTYEEVAKVDGKPTATRKLVISPDGKTLTITARGTDSRGQAMNNVVVFDKQ